MRSSGVNVAEHKDYGLIGVGRNLQFGKQGPVLVGNADTDTFTVTMQDGATLTTMGGANATDTTHFITKAQLDVVYTEATFKANVNYNDSSPILLGNITSGTKTIITTLTIGTAFDDANAVVTIGTSANANLLMSDNYCEIEVNGVYQTVNIVEFANNTSLNIYVTQAGATAGAGNVLVSVVDGPVVDGGTINYGGGGGVDLTDLSVTSNSPSGNGSLVYNNTTGVFTFTPADASLSNYGNSNVVTLLSSLGSNTVVTTGNISAGYFVGNGSLLTGITAGTNYTNSNVVTLLSSFGSNTIVTTGNVSAGNVITTGTALTGISAIVAGVTNTLLPNTVASFSANVNNYTQVTLQNKSSGADATADFVITANNGSDTVNFADFGIINSGYDNTTPTNSLGNIVFAADTYLYAQGNSSSVSQSGGNLAIGTTTVGKTVKVFAGGANSNSIVGTFSNTGLAVTGTVSGTGNISTSGKFIGDGSSLTNVTVSVAGNITGTSQNVSLVAGSFTATFDNTGILTLPRMGGDEGGEINFGVPATNTTLSTRVVLDVYQDRLRIFDGNTKGAYIDLSQAATGVGTLLNNRVSGLVNAGTFVTMDLIKATVTTSGNRGLSLAATTGSFAINIGGTYATTTPSNGGSAGTMTVTTTASASVFNWGFTNQGDIATYIITDTTNSRAYRITVQIGNSYNNNMISIERLI